MTLGGWLLLLGLSLPLAACAPHRLSCRDEEEFYRPSSDSPG